MATNGNKRYVAGQRFEYRVRDLYRKYGWFVVKSAGSKGKADLVALKAGRQPHLIQCKSGAVESREYHEAVELDGIARTHGATGVLASRSPNGAVVLQYTGQGYRDLLDFNLTEQTY